MNGEREAAEEDEKHAKQEERKRRAADRAVKAEIKNHIAGLDAEYAKKETYTAQVLRERAEQKVKDDAYWAKRDDQQKP